MRRVAIEGPCCAGKTTLARALLQRLGAAAAHVRCYADHVGGGRFLPPPVPRTVTEDAESLQKLLAIERDRNASACRSGADSAVMDRSVHTLLAHRRAIERVYGLPVEQPAADALAASALAVWPDLVLYLDVPTDVIRARSRPKFPPGSVFVAEAFNREFRGYFTDLAASPTANVTWLDGTAAPAALVHEALAALRR